MGLYDRDYYREWLDEQKKKEKWKDQVRQGRKINPHTKTSPLVSLLLVVIGFAIIFEFGLKLYNGDIKIGIPKRVNIDQPTVTNIFIQQSVPATTTYTQNRPQYLPSAEPRTNAQPEVVYIERQQNSISNAEDNHRRLQAIQERERECNYWRTKGLNYDLETVTLNIRQFCR